MAGILLLIFIVIFVAYILTSTRCKTSGDSFIIQILRMLDCNNRNKYPPEPFNEGKLKWLHSGSRALNLSDMAPWLSYYYLSKRYGPVLSLSPGGLFSRKIILLSSLDSIRTLFVIRSGNYCTRPVWRMAQLMGRQDNVAFTPYNASLKTARRLLHVQFAQNRLRENWEPSITCEIDLFLKKLLSICSHDGEVNGKKLSDILQLHAQDMATQLTYGHRASAEYVHEAQEISTDTVSSLIPGRWALEKFPILYYFPSFLPGMAFKRWAERAKIKFETQNRNAFENSMRKMHSGTYSDENNYLVKLWSQHHPRVEDISILCSTAGSIYGAATETTSALFHSAIYLLSLHPKAQSIAYSQIQELGRLPSISDGPSLPYITALIKETHRIRPIVNLINHAPRYNDEFNGWRIKKGTWIMANIWSICHDDKIFQSPGTFLPERYISHDGTLASSALDPREFTFGFGRRRCPGEHLSNAHVFILLSRLLYFFRVVHTSESDKGCNIFNGAMPSTDYTSTFISRPKEAIFNQSIKLIPRQEHTSDPSFY